MAGMLRILLAIFFCVSFFQPLIGQESKKYDGQHTKYYEGEDLYSKKQYSAAMEVLSEYLKNRYFHHQYTLKARYYEAMCALRLYLDNTEQYILQFIRDYPESIYTEQLYLDLAQYFYQQRKFKKAIRYFENITPYDVPNNEYTAYYFKLGYAHYNEENFQSAKENFYQIKDSSSSQYAAPATYYYAHIAYDNEKYQSALENFRKLKDHKTFGSVVPYYITQILYLQGSYEAITKNAPEIGEGNNQKREAEMARLIGDAYYRVEKYDEAIPYLQKYQQIGKAGRNDNYQLGYAYLQIKDYKKAAQYLSYVTRPKDSLAQIALYQLGVANEKFGKNEFAKNAFEEAASMDYDASIEEDALYRYALLAYKMDFNPYKNAISAFTQYLEQYPNSDRKTEVYQYLINVYTSTKNYKAALESLNDMAQLDPPMQQAYQIVAFNHGVELYESNKYDASIDVFETVKRHPIDRTLNAKSIYWIASAYHKQDAYSKAIQKYRNFLKEPGAYSLDYYNEVHYQIGYAYFEQKQYTNAISSFRTYTQSSDDNERLEKEALLRAADAYFLMGKDEQAIDFYTQAKSISNGDSDYAIYQSARAKGYVDQYDEKIDDLHNIINNYSESMYRTKAIYEIAETYLKDMGQREKALKHYQQLIRDYPKNVLVQASLFEVGGIYLQKENYKQAEDIFLRILKEYDDRSTQKQALTRLKDVYVGMGEPDKFYGLADQYEFSNISTSSKDSISYSVAYRAYIDSNCQKAKSGFTKYLDQFKNAIFQKEALYYRASCYWENEQKEKAFKDYEALLKLSKNEFTENALLRASKMEYKKEHYEDALEYYARLESAATFKSNKLAAHIGQMRTYFYMEDWASAVAYADKVLNNEETPDNVIVESYYVRGLAYKSMNNQEKALADLKKCAAKNQGAIGAEAKFYTAKIHYLQGDYDKTEKEIKSLIQNRPSFQYWVAKGFILLGKNLIEQENYFQARHTLESVLENYQKKDDDVRQSAQETLDYLEELEAERDKKDEEAEGETVIELEGEDENGGK